MWRASRLFPSLFCGEQQTKTEGERTRAGGCWPTTRYFISFFMFALSLSKYVRMANLFCSWHLSQSVFQLRHGPGLMKESTSENALGLSMIAQRGQRTPFSVACTLSFSIHSPAFPTHSWVNLLESNVGSIEQRALSARSGAKGQRSFMVKQDCILNGKILLRV